MVWTMVYLLILGKIVKYLNSKVVGKSQLKYIKEEL